jgi:RNA polymerase sigma-70 factor (ECF subfamily)
MAAVLLAETLDAPDSWSDFAVPARRGELEQLYSECRQALFTCALVITSSPSQAEDAVHDAFCQLLRREEAEAEDVGDLKAYAFRAVRNAAIDQLRRGRRATEPLADFVFDPSPPPGASAEDAEFRNRAVELMQMLSPDERETIVQHLYGQLTFQQIATIRDIPRGTVASWYRRGLEKLRRQLKVADGTV